MMNVWELLTENQKLRAENTRLRDRIRKLIASRDLWRTRAIKRAVRR